MRITELHETPQLDGAQHETGVLTCEPFPAVRLRTIAGVPEATVRTASPFSLAGNR